MTDVEVNDFPTPEQSAAYFDSLPPSNRQRIKPIQLVNLNADAEAEKDSAKISKDAPAIVAFADGVSEQNREAVLLGVEFAETVANKKADVNNDAVEWLTAYAGALKQAGWLTTGGHEYGSYTSKNQNLQMDSLVLELISAVAGPNAATVVSLLGLVLDKLQKNDPLMKLFESNSRRGTVSQFRIMPCIESSAGIPITYLLSVHCDYRHSSGGALFWKWSVSRLDIKRLAKGVQFSKGTYERNKGRILDFLEGEADDFFEGLK
ncbi:hypothetical protein TRP66_13610 [Pseudomonas sp. JDS28PS106]|uniref:hypothetical protein n=1 Tax=Pseudomonas sp. JDS28PS106 TaxID=2497235 RepID=UPI002FCFBA46